MSKNTDKNEEIYDDLQELGLSKNEAVVYTSLLKQGEVGASKIVRDTNLHGQTVYDALHNLGEQNLVRYNLVKGRKKFVAQSPSILADLIEKKKKVADKIVEKIEKNFSTMDFQDIEILKGQESFVSNEMNLLKEQAEHTNIMVFGGSGDSYLKNMGNKINDYDYIRNKKKISVMYIGGEEEISFMKSIEEKRPLFKYRYLPEMLSGITNITILENQALIMYLFDETVTKIVIRNKKIVESYTGFFKGLWKMAK